MPRSNPESIPVNELTLERIHDDVDDEFCHALAAFITEKKMNVGRITASLAFVLGDIIGQNCTSHESACVVASLYGDYAHNTAHYSFEENEKKDESQTSH